MSNIVSGKVIHGEYISYNDMVATAIAFWRNNRRGKSVKTINEYSVDLIKESEISCHESKIFEEDN